jgi:homoserine dehydrogenase
MTPHSLVILKFGGSVLTDTGAIPAAVQEITRYLASYDRVIAVVSAFKNQTDTLENAAAELCDRPSPEALAFYMGLGEMRAAGELTLGLQGAGIKAAIRMPWDVEFLSNGSVMNATPLSVSRQAFLDAFQKHDVVVFPGYVSRGKHGEPNVLGRGGSDLTAIFLAAELKADHCILLKDTPGVYEWDPRTDGRPPRRYARIHWDDALRLCGRMLQPEHVAYARSRSVTIQVMAIGKPGSTGIGPAASEFDTSQESTAAEESSGT